ncbi:MAG: hypothetical protein SFU85_03485 [Candidatus Methylacidiphilales bacterium]|nr:hypothetical protein [Candidatus Methylacidiphilales bacterium]
MNVRVVLALMVCGLVAACSREEGVSPDYSIKALPPIKAESTAPSVVRALPPAVTTAVATLNTEPDYQLKIKALEVLRETYSQEACTEMVKHLKHQFSQLPPALRPDDGYDEATFYRLGYMGVLLQEIRKMDFPEGNQATVEVMEIMRKRYTGQPQGDRWIRIFASGLNNTAEDVKNGLYPKQATPADQATLPLPK